MSTPQWNPNNPVVPYDKYGNLLHYPAWDTDSWEEFQPLETQMRLVGMRRGRSAAYFVVEDNDGCTYSMFMADLEKILMGPGIVNGITPVLRWTPSKRGANYGIKWME